MAEEFQRTKLYQYSANSNLVLEAERDSRRRTDEGTGEVESLHGKLNTVRMGDRINHEKRPELDDRIEKAKQKRIRSEADDEAVKKKKKDNRVFVASKGSTVLTETEDLDSINYRPKTRESRAAYEEILGFVQVSLGDQPQDILRGAADEILSLLKDESMRAPDRQKEIEKIISRQSSEKYNKLVNLGKKITDFHSTNEEEEEDEVKMDEEMGVAVVFEDDDEDAAQADLDEVNESEEEDDDEGGVEAFGSGTLKGEDEGADDGAGDDKYTLSVHDIDAYWLQRQLSRFYTDANISAKLADETLLTLQIADERACENRLVVLLDFDKFDFIKLLLKNRSKIFFCTRLKQAQTDADRIAIEKEMMMSVDASAPLILQQLNQKASVESWTQDRIGEFANKARREARALIKGSDKGVGGVGDEAEDATEATDGRGIGSMKVQEKLVDLEGLQFAQGGHLMANKRCELPEKSWRAQKKGYEEVHVPAVRPIISSDERLVDVANLPEWVQPAFQEGGVRTLNRIQSKMVPAALYSSENLLLCAPTSSGKTNVALLCILNQLGNYRREDGTFDLTAFKIVYIAPMKALVQECVLSFGKKLKPYGINVRELSGDQNLTREQIEDTQLIVTTPEKWDIITRKNGERTYTQLVRLIIIDEIHLLHDDRGAVLESIVVRTLRQIENNSMNNRGSDTSEENVRLVGLSATLPNFEDVATFLRVKPDKGLFYFDNSFRPVPLQQQYIGVSEKKALKRFQIMNEICYEKVLQKAGKNQILIFTHSRIETAKTARALRDLAVERDEITQFIGEGASREILKEEAESVKNSDLKDLLPFGFAIHHAGMVRSDRTLVEDLFSDKHIQVLVSTATLAWGVNLPCHTVIIKGTQIYNPQSGGFQELYPLDILQMIGRAGRYGLDREGEGIIITTHNELQFYLSLLNQQLPIESQFIKKINDIINAEIVLGSILNVKDAVNYLSYTYLFVRMLRNPTLYGVTAQDLAQDPLLLQRRTDLVHSAASMLEKHNMIKYDRKSGALQVTTLGRVASHYYVSFDSISVFNEYLKPNMSEIELFRLFSLSGEFKLLYVREEEKLELLKLVNRVPIPVKEGVEEPSAKVNVLLQAYISRLKLEGFALVSDMTYIQQSACRLLRALFELALKRGWASLTSRTLALCKMVERRVWGSQSPLRQFNLIPEIIIRKLEKNSDIQWDRYYDLKSTDLGEMVKIPKMGKSLHKYVHMFPKLQLSALVQPITRILLKIDLTIVPDFQYDEAVHGKSCLFYIIVEDNDGEKILHHESFSLRSQHATLEHFLTFYVPISDPLPPQYFIKVVSDRWLHSETTLPVSFRHLILPQKNAPPTDLLDLQPLPISAIPNKKLYKGFTVFNAIQTQTFSSLYQTDENVLVCAPAGSGKTVLAEFAILRMFSTQPDGKCIYIAPKEEIADSMYSHWADRFENADRSLDINVVRLTGDTTADLKLLERGNLIITTAVQWDMLSRRWKQRKNIQNIALYIIDELHLLGGTEGPTLEIVVSRARYVASQLDKKVRIVGLSSSLTNAKDVGDWLGANSVYNFAPDARPVPLEVHITGFDSNHCGSRLLAMSKPVYTAITTHSPDKPVIVFVPNRKQTQLTSIDLITYAAASGQPNRFLRVDAQKMNDVLDTIKEPALLQTLAHGVGFIHDGMGKGDRERVEGLYRDGVISVLVVPRSYCWSVQSQAHLVVVVDTVYYEGKEHRFIDYNITDIQQMLGLASRPMIDEVGKCVVLCYSPKKEYLKQLLSSALPIESHLNLFLHDHINSEIVNKIIENKQDAVDYLTWTFFYRRIANNPNYYNLQGSSFRHLSDHLSEIVEGVISDLEESKCLAVEEEVDISPLNLGLIASYYYIQYTTIEIFSSSVTEKTKIKGLIEILAAASEYSNLPVRQGEGSKLLKIMNNLPQAEGAKAPSSLDYDDPSTKALVLLQSHFSRLPLFSTDLSADTATVLGSAVKLIQSLVDVVSSFGWLKTVLTAMELSQMVVQGVWSKGPKNPYSHLLQIPHFTAAIAKKCFESSPPVVSVFDILELEDEQRSSLLADLSEEKMSDVAIFCNAYPNLDLSFVTDIEGGEVVCGDTVSVVVTVQRESEEDEEEEKGESTVGRVVCPRYGLEKQEAYWLVIGDINSNALLSIKRISIGDKPTKTKLEFTAPENPGDYNMVLYLMSDSYLGCDQEYEIPLTVLPDEGEDGDEEDEDA